jgi:WhiB family redox-sensing transcriptional regulator
MEHDLAWQDNAACRGEDPDTFFHPEGERGPAREARERAAKAVCAACPVLAQCAAHALAVREPYGVWGGMSEDERRALKRRVARNRARMAELNRMAEDARESV